MSSPIYSAIKQISDEKGIPMEAVIETIESALAAAYRKDFGNRLQNIKVEFDAKTGGIKVFDVKEVVENPPEEELIEEISEEEVKETTKEIAAPAEGEEKEEIKRFNPKTQIGIDEAKKIKKGIKIGEELVMDLEVPGEFGRMAAQTAKQVITQKLREVERQTVFDEFKSKENTIITGTVQRREGKIVLVDLGRTTAVMLPDGQIQSERYFPGSRFKFYVSSVAMTTKGPEILISRAHPEIVKKMFEIEIPEVDNGSIEIKAIAREAGSRTKIAVASKDENIDPIGSCVGQRGTRIQTIISELGGEKIDIIEWDEDIKKFISNALSPAKIISVEINEANKTAVVMVKSDQLSLAIGRGGQNVRLAAKLTGFKLDIAEAKEDGTVEKIESEGGLKPEENKTPAEVLEKESVEQPAKAEDKKEKKEVKKKKKTTKSKSKK
ncbi:MAG: transcription termination factor NusA [Patescibacteria group bacterium]|nr:transcription termination factor NusA [Patescibacteria group bacterium]MDD5490784.1 transcription termination factor NusA [Patescibacteria group bacterium]